MKVYELLEIIEEGKGMYKDFENWDVAFEHVPNPHEDCNTKDDILIGNDNWTFIKSHCMKCSTYFTVKKVLGLQIHY